MAWPPILVRYGEIGIKSRQVRLHFERVLVERIEEQLLRRKVESEVKRDWGRIFVRAGDVDAALDALAHTFGVVSASPAIETDATPDAVAATVLDVARAQMPLDAGFAVRVKRSGKHAFTSLDVAKACAARILDDLADRRPHVDLDAPTFELHAEVREGGAFVFQRTVRGPGGLPLGSQGRVGVLVDAPRAAHAAWLMAKRGSLPFFFAAQDAPSAEWLAPLQAWVPDTRVRALDGTTRAEQLASVAPLLAQHRCQALVVADDVEQQFARFAEDKAAGVPVFRPLTGYAGARFEALDGQVRS